MHSLPWPPEFGRGRDRKGRKGERNGTRRDVRRKANGWQRGHLPLRHAQLGDLLRAGEDLHHVARDVPAREGGPGIRPMRGCRLWRTCSCFLLRGGGACGGNIEGADNRVLRLVTGNASGVPGRAGRGSRMAVVADDSSGVSAWRVGKGGRAFLRHALAEGEEVDLHALEAAGDGDDLAQPAREGRHPDRLGVEVEPADLPPPPLPPPRSQPDPPTADSRRGASAPAAAREDQPRASSPRAARASW